MWVPSKTMFFRRFWVLEHLYDVLRLSIRRTKLYSSSMRFQWAKDRPCRSNRTGVMTCQTSIFFSRSTSEAHTWSSLTTPMKRCSSKWPLAPNNTAAVTIGRQVVICQTSYQLVRLWHTFSKPSTVTAFGSCCRAETTVYRRNSCIMER